MCAHMSDSTHAFMCAGTFSATHVPPLTGLASQRSEEMRKRAALIVSEYLAERILLHSVCRTFYNYC